MRPSTCKVVPPPIVRKNVAAISTKIYDKPTRTGFRLAGPRDNPTTGTVREHFKPGARKSQGVVHLIGVLVQILLSVCICLARGFVDFKRPGPRSKFPERWVLVRLVG